MSVFVILALACAVMACAAAVLATFPVVSASRRLAGTVGETMAQLRPLVDELTQEAAVTAAELEAFSARGGDR
ncbi:MAG: hypothetical protein WD080_04360 [Egibacteraceae bacterium]